MKIALFCPWLKSKGGAERFLLEFLKHTKHNVDVYTWTYNRTGTFEEFKKFKIKVIAPRITEKLAKCYILRGLFFPIALFSKILLEKYDVFLISTGGLSEFITFSNYKPEATYTYVHTILRAAYEEDIKWNLKYRYRDPLSKLVYLIATKIYKILEKRAWKKIDVAIFNSNLSLERAKKHTLVKSKKIYVVHPGIDTKKIRPGKTKDYFLYVARFGKAKRQDILIEAWKSFVKKYPQYKMILVGSIENKKYFDEINKKSSGIKNIEIKTNVSDEELLKLYATCLAVVFVPFMEDFGIVPFEALAAGKTLIAMDKGGYVELVRGAPSVIWIKEKIDPEKTAGEIYKALSEFIKKKDFYLKNAIKNRHYVKKLNLSWKNFAEKIDTILEWKS